MRALRRCRALYLSIAVCEHDLPVTTWTLSLTSTVQDNEAVVQVGVIENVFRNLKPCDGVDTG